MAVKRKSNRRRTRKKTGNGTKAKQWIYILFHFPIIGVICKIGITGKETTDERILGISKSLPGFVFPIFAIRVRNAYGVEQFIKHGFYGFFGVPFIGSGKTEWYMSLVLPFALVIILVWWALPVVYLALIIFLILFSTGNKNKIKHAAKTAIAWARSVVRQNGGGNTQPGDETINFEVRRVSTDAKMDQ